MMKFAVPVLSLFLVLSLSQASTIALTQAQGSRKPSTSLSQTPTKSVLVRAVPRYQRQLLTVNELDDNNDTPSGADDLSLHQSYRRPELVIESDQDISDYAKTRLLIARARALQKYRETWM